MRIALAQINPTVGDIAGNVRKIVHFIERARDQGAALVVFPELALIGYPPKDLLLKPQFIDDNLRALRLIAGRVKGIDAIVGYADRNPQSVGRPLLNAVALLRDGKVVSCHFKTLLPTYDVFDESRYFEPGPPSDRLNLVRLGDLTAGLSICEDLWNDEKMIPRRLYHQNPIATLHAAGAELLINTSASPFVVGKHDFRLELFSSQVRQFGQPLVYVNQVGGNDELVFDGNSVVFDAAGNVIAQAREFEEDLLLVDLDRAKRAPKKPSESSDPGPEVLARRGPGAEESGSSEYLRPGVGRAQDELRAQDASHAREVPHAQDAPRAQGAPYALGAPDARDASRAQGEPHPLGAPDARDAPGAQGAHGRSSESASRDEIPNRVEKHSRGVESVYHALVLGLRDYVRKCGFSSAVLGLSGGIDSALTAAIAVAALGPDKVVGVAMPSRFSSEHSVTDAQALAANLQIAFHIIPIKDVHDAYERTLATAFEGCVRDVTEENLQARSRGAILMAFSNKFNHLLLTTGNKSELAVGYCTLYGDMCGGLGVISDVPKTTVYELSEFVNARAGREIIPQNTITKPPSAELRPNQTDQDSLPEYAILDAILHRYVEQEQSAPQIVADGFDPATVVRVIKLIDRSEYKRRQAAPGLKVTSRAFGFGRRMPIAQNYQQLPPPADGTIDSVQEGSDHGWGYEPAKD